MVIYKLVYDICVFWFALQYHVTIIRAFIKALNKKCHYCLHSLSNHCCLRLLIEWYIKEEKTCFLTSLNINQIIVKDPIIQSLKAISLSSCDYMHTRAYAWILGFFSLIMHRHDFKHCARKHQRYLPWGWNVQGNCKWFKKNPHPTPWKNGDVVICDSGLYTENTLTCTITHYRARKHKSPPPFHLTWDLTF